MELHQAQQAIPTQDLPSPLEQGCIWSTKLVLSVFLVPRRRTNRVTYHPRKGLLSTSINRKPHFDVYDPYRQEIFHSGKP